jgi:dTDP-4-dehydrorhamnose reductase
MLARALIPALERAGHAALAPPESEADVTRPEALERALAPFGPDWIAHLAAFTRVDDCESEPARAFAVNAGGSRAVAELARRIGAGVLALSTDYVFDGRSTRPYREDDPVAPRSVYGRSKWEGEQAVREALPRHLIVRTAWLYGPGGPNFLDTILARARAGEALRVVDDQRGSPTFTADLAEGLARLLAVGAPGTYHCTNSGDCTWYDLAVHALARAGIAARVERTDTAGFPRPAPRPAYSVLDNARFEAATGWRMPRWQDAVDRFLAAPVRAAAPTGGQPT